jgi:hypothetical protein
VHPRVQPTCLLIAYVTAPSVAHICPWMGFLAAAVAVPQAHACVCPHVGPLTVATQACPSLVVAMAAAAFAVPSLACTHACTRIRLLAVASPACPCPFVMVAVVVSQARTMPCSLPRGPTPRAVRWWLLQLCLPVRRWRVLQWGLVCHSCPTTLSLACSL